MRVTGFSVILGWLGGAAVLAALALPVHAAGGGGHAPDPGAETPLPALVPQAPLRVLDVPADELADRPPAEPPPGDFTAAQYIDSAGCVFVRTPQGWRARIARDGSTICGYPPTYSARRSAPDALQPLLPEPEEPRARRIERELVAAIVPNLHDGELAAPQGPAANGPDHGAADRTADQAPGGPVPAAAHAHDAGTELAVAAASAPPGDPLGLAAAVTAAPVLAAAFGGARTDRLCGLIGADQAARPGIGGSSALGFCGATAAALPAPVAALSSAAIPAPAAPEPAQAGVSDPAAAGHGARNATPRALAAGLHPGSAGSAKPEGKSAARGKKGGKSNRKPGPAAARRTAVAGPMMVPPGARYVQVGAFRDAGNASRTARRLIGMGLPVVTADQHGTRLVMVGPLPGRESIIRTIDRVRRAGYSDAYARR